MQWICQQLYQKRFFGQRIPNHRCSEICILEYVKREISLQSGSVLVLTKLCKHMKWKKPFWKYWQPVFGLIPWTLCLTVCVLNIPEIGSKTSILIWLLVFIMFLSQPPYKFAQEILNHRARTNDKTMNSVHFLEFHPIKFQNFKNKIHNAMQEITWYQYLKL